MIKAIIFDFFGVFTPDLYWGWIERHAQNLEKDKDFFQKLSDEVDKADISWAEFVERASKAANADPKNMTNEMLRAAVINTELLGLIVSLKKNYKIGLLTNAAGDFLDMLVAEYNLAPYFDEMVVSSRVRMIKPQRGIFEYALKELDVSPQETIFIDDRQVHVSGARAVGIDGILYEGMPKLRAELEKRGVEM